MPMYFAVSRTTEIDDAVAGSRALQNVGRGDLREIALHLIGDLRFDRRT